MPQLTSSLVLEQPCESYQLHLQASSRPVPSQLQTRLDSSSQLCQAQCGQLVLKREELCAQVSCKRAHFKTAKGGSGPGRAAPVHANAGGARDTESYQEQALNGFGGRSLMQSKAPARGTNTIHSYFPVQCLLQPSTGVISAPI